MKWIYILLAVILCAVCIVCGVLGKHEPVDDGDYCMVDGKRLSFLSEKQMSELREPLIKLLANCEQLTDPDGFTYEAPDPDSPSIAYGYSCGLLDITSDGIPELMVIPWGYSGSSGSVTYYAYDIITGEKIDEVYSGEGTICCYYNTDRGSVSLVNSYVTQSGWDVKDITVDAMSYDEIGGGLVDDFTLREDHIINLQIAADEPHVSTVQYYLNGERATWGDYHAQLEYFNVNYIRIPETELDMIHWHDNADDEDRFVRAEKMADALLSSGQKFIVP